MVETKCIHGRRKRSCVECDGSAICIHKIRKERCEECGGSALCEHKIEKYKCFKCKGGIFCIHDKRKERCDECIKLLFCEHNNRKATCEQCKAERTCEHEKTRDKCNICNPSYLHCEHGITKYLCKLCGGSAWCFHEKYKSRCIDCKISGCGGSSLCITTLCEGLKNKKYKGHCLRCFIHLFPDEPVTCNYKTKETSVVKYLMEQFPDFTWIWDKKVQDECSKKLPDLFLDLGFQVLIVEIDENGHDGYDNMCENKRVMELSKDVEHRPIVLIRFNPDGYTDKNEKKIPSCWCINKQGVCVVRYQRAWEERLAFLQNQIQYWIDNRTEKTIEHIPLYFDGM